MLLTGQSYLLTGCISERSDDDVCSYMHVNHVDGRNSGDLRYEKNTTRRQYIWIKDNDNAEPRLTSIYVDKR